jgi:hypothetical protein
MGEDRHKKQSKYVDGSDGASRLDDVMSTDLNLVGDFALYVAGRRARRRFSAIVFNRHRSPASDCYATPA